MRSEGVLLRENDDLDSTKAKGDGGDGGDASER